MDKAYRFDDEKPMAGTTVYAFKTLAALKDFARGQGSRGNMKFWEITGTIVENDGSVDGIRIRVNTAREVN